MQYPSRVQRILNTTFILFRVGDPVPLTLLLGEISYDNNKNITGAKATKMSYFLKNQEVFVKSKGRKVCNKHPAVINYY